MTRLIAKLLVLVAVLLMPLGMSPAAAGASMHHDMASMSMGHCPDQAPSPDKKSGFGECTMACAAALPAVEASAAELPIVPAELQRLALTDRLHGLHPETATPPPKRA
jgi:hypothetical protein